MEANTASSKNGEGINPSLVPIVLDLNLDKVNYLLSLLGSLPYEKVSIVIQDIQTMASIQLDKYNAAQQLKADADKVKITP